MRVAWHTFNAGARAQRVVHSWKRRGDEWACEECGVSGGAGPKPSSDKPCEATKSGANVSSVGFHKATIGHALERGWEVLWIGHDTEFPGTQRVEVPVPPLCDERRGHVFAPLTYLPEVDLAVFRYCDVFFRRHAQVTAIWEYVKRRTPCVIFDADLHFKSEQSLKEIPRDLDPLKWTWVCSTYPVERGMHRHYFETTFPYQRELELPWDDEAEAEVDQVYVGNCYDRASIHRWYGEGSRMADLNHEVWGYGWKKGEKCFDGHRTQIKREADEPGLNLMGYTQTPIQTYRRGRFSIGVVKPLYEQWGMWTPRINEVTQAARAFVWDPKLPGHKNLVAPELLRRLKPERRKILVERLRERLRRNTPEDWWNRIFERTGVSP